jgi:putative addiction module CopG family antidote
MGMTITLSPELEAVVRREIESGRYETAEEYVADAIQDLHERLEETLDEEREQLDASIAEADRGEVADEQQVRQEMREMKAQWAKARSAA